MGAYLFILSDALNNTQFTVGILSPCCTSTRFGVQCFGDASHHHHESPLFEDQPRNRIIMNHETYVCDTCKKATDLVVNQRGVTTLPRCTITQNCKGIFGRVDPLTVDPAQYIVNGVSTQAWDQRRTLYNHDQLALRKVWTISHNLHCFPSVAVFADLGGLIELDSRAYTIQYISNDTLSITFLTGYTGIVQCTAQHKATNAVAARVDTASTLVNPISTITLATVADTAAFILINTFTATNVPDSSILLPLAATNLTGTWAGTEYIHMFGTRLKLYQFNTVRLIQDAIDVGTFSITLVDSQTVPVEGVGYLLLSREPFKKAADRRLDATISIKSVAVAGNAKAVIASGQLLCSESLHIPVFPIIKAIE